VGAFVITTAIAIFWDAVNTIFDQVTGQIASSGAAPIALWVALITVALKLGLMLFTRRLGQQTNNAAVLALAYDHRNDIFSAGAAALGIFLGRAGFPWVDPLAGALVALVVLRTGIKIIQDSTSELMDTIPGAHLESQIREILSSISGVQKVEAIHAHRFGPYLVVNLTIGVNGDLTVAEGDRIASLAEKELYKQVDFMKLAHIHFHPAS
jgi:cation diffusion facilitator family transporter